MSSRKSRIETQTFSIVWLKNKVTLSWKTKSFREKNRPWLQLLKALRVSLKKLGATWNWRRRKSWLLWRHMRTWWLRLRRKFDVDVDSVIQTVKSLWHNLDMAHLEQALSQPGPKSLGMVHPNLDFPTSSSKPSKTSQPGPGLQSPGLLQQLWVLSLWVHLF